jgi:hypothetical protein
MELNMSETANTPDSGTGPLTPQDAAGLLGRMLNDDADEAPPEDVDAVSEEDAEEGTPEPEEDGDDGDAEDLDGDEATDKPTPKGPEKVEITLPDGTRATVTHEELTKGYLRQSDYTRKAQAIAEQARQIEARSQQELAKIQETLRRVEEAFPQDQEPDWVKLAQEDPFYYAEQRATWEAKQKALTQAREQAQRAFAEQRQKSAVEFQQRVQNEIVAARSHPLFADVASDEKARDERQAALLKTAQSMGFSDEDFGNVVDHRVYALLEKARRYDDMVSKAKAVEKSAPEVVRERRPGTKPTGNSRDQAISKSLKQLRQTSGRQQRNIAINLLGKL